jgi:DNA primase
MTAYTTEMFNRQDIERLKELAEFRNFDIQTLITKQIFYVNKPIELMLPDYINYLNTFGLISNINNKPIYHQRWVIPIRDTDGKVLNFVGYSPNYNERYLYAESEVYLRRDTLYGLENLNQAYKKGYAILCEGITDAIALHNLGYNIAFANCGTYRSAFNLLQLNRCKNGVILIPDRDKAGSKAVKGWNFDKCVKINVPVKYKDIDEVLRKSENREEVKKFIDFAIQHLINTPSNCQDEITITL